MSNKLVHTTTTVRDIVDREVIASGDRNSLSDFSPKWRLQGRKSGVVIETKCRLSWKEAEDLCRHIVAIRERLMQPITIEGGVTDDDR